VKIAITGANGFIGIGLINALLSGGHEVLAISRKSTINTTKFPSGISFIQCDLLNPTGLVEALKSCQLVIHLAAEMSGTNMYDNTVLATKNLLTVMANAGVKKIILCGSISVVDYSNSLPFHTIDETTPLCTNDDSVGVYAKMKREQERLIEEWALEQNAALILRLGLVYSDDQISTDHLGFAKGKLALISNHHGEVPLVHLNSVANAFSAACAYEFVDNRKTLNIIDDNLPTQIDYIRKLKHIEKFKFGLKVPWKVYSYISSIVRLIFTVSGLSRKIPDAFHKNSTSGRATPFLFSNKNAKRALDWDPMKVDINNQ
jgi:nucleoside-diphosphate-sugar epimerase